MATSTLVSRGSSTN